MRLLTPFATLGLVAVLGCGDVQTNTTKVDRKTVTANRDGTVTEKHETTEVKVRREEARTAMQSRFNELDRTYDQYAEKAAKASGDAKVRMDKHLAELKVQRDAAAVQLKKFNDDASDAWQDMKKGIDKAFDDLKMAYEKAKTNFD